MYNDIYKVKKRRKKKVVNTKKHNYLFHTINSILICGLMLIISLILIKSNDKFKAKFYHYVYDTNISFASINNWYTKTFGSPIPFKNLIKENITTVFEEKLKYTDQSIYLDGVSLTVDDNYLVPVLETGMVVFIGEKEGYGNTIIIEQVDGIDVWYGNIDKESVKLYDYVEKGSLLGEVNNTLYLVYKKDGNVLDYKDYLEW